MKRNIRIIFCCSLLLILAATSSGRADSSYFEVDREFYPYYPSLVKWNPSKTPFTEPEVCARCHPRQYEEWNGSVHALAFQDPVFQSELNRAFKTVGPEVTRQCEGCHSPAGLVTGDIKGPGLAGLGRMSLAGVSCDVCHSISGVTHWQTPSREPENGSFILSPGGDGADGVKPVKYGPAKPASGCGGGFHECAESPLVLRADLCASCHQLTHHETYFPLETTYAEWQRSPYAQKGILCQDCHMVAFDDFIRTADTLQKPKQAKYQHYFSGANYLLFHFAEAAARKRGEAKLAAGIRKKSEMAVARLKAAAELEIIPVYRNRALAEVKVRVKNIRAGHDLPTSLMNVRQIWVEVTIKAPGGKSVLTSGEFDSMGALPPGARVSNTEGVDRDFHFSKDPASTADFSRRKTIPARGFREVDFGVAPVKKQGMVAVEARLRYRQADRTTMMRLLESLPEDMDLEKMTGSKDVPVLPVVEMAVKKARFKSRQ